MKCTQWLWQVPGCLSKSDKSLSCLNPRGERTSCITCSLYQVVALFHPCSIYAGVGNWGKIIDCLQEFIKACDIRWVNVLCPLWIKTSRPWIGKLGPMSLVLIDLVLAWWPASQISYKTLKAFYVQGLCNQGMEFDPIMQNSLLWWWEQLLGLVQSSPDIVPINLSTKRHRGKLKAGEFDDC